MKRADAHPLAITAVGTAALLDPRVSTHDRTLIGEIAAGLLDAGMHVAQHELVDAVKAHYDDNETLDKVSWPALLQLIRAARKAKAEAEWNPDPTRAERDRLDYLDMMDAINSWACPAPDCGAQSGEWCRNVLTGKRRAFAPHHQRARLALDLPEPRLQWTGPATDRGDR